MMRGAEKEKKKDGSCSVCEAYHLLKEQILGHLHHLPQLIITHSFTLLHARTHTHTRTHTLVIVASQVNLIGLNCCH